MNIALICPCGECPLNPAFWECRECASQTEMDEAFRAYEEHLAENDKNCGVRHDA